MLKKRKNILSLLLIALLSVSVLLSGCGSVKTESASTSPSTTAKVINIGWSGPLSGGAAQYGKDTLDGLQMAVDEINGGGGITVNGQKYTFKVISLDDQYKPDMTATNGRRLVSEYKAPVIFVPHTGGIFALQEFNIDDKFLIEAHSSDPTVAPRNNKLTYIGAPAYSGQPVTYSKIAMQKFGKKVALIPAVTQYGKDWAAAMETAWKNNGGTVTGSFPLDFNTQTDFFPYISKALASNPDVIYVGGPSQPSALLIKQAKQQGFKGGFIISDQPRLEDMEKVVALSELNGTIALMPLYQWNTPGVKKFVEAFKTKYNGKVPTFHNAGMYMAMKLIAMGMEKSGSVNDPSKFYAGMKQVLPIKGDSMPYELDNITDNGQLVQPDQGVIITDGKYGQPFPIIAK
ncbi:ABC transporter substrate-binding protein [Paradesulfitobacterium aromaticivorans]